MTSRDAEAPGNLVGVWKKVRSSACDEKYPDTVTFAGGTYRGTRGAGQGMIWWDAGIYRVEDAHTLVVGTATDELVSYRIELHGDRLTVTDPDDCRFTYRRQASGS